MSSAQVGPHTASIGSSIHRRGQGHPQGRVGPNRGFHTNHWRFSTAKWGPAEFPGDNVAVHNSVEAQENPETKWNTIVSHASPSVRKEAPSDPHEALWKPWGPMGPHVRPWAPTDPSWDPMGLMTPCDDTHQLPCGPRKCHTGPQGDQD